MKSTRTDNIQSSPKSKHLSLIERQQIERWLNERVSVTEIANRLGRIKSSISREIKRGKDTFSTIFKSITCDNGVEFQDFKGIEQSVYSKKKKKRTKVYFAHPYSSFERGSNENANRLIRRFLPKGTTFDELSQRVVQRLARWMNKIPRKLFDGKSANEMVKALGLNFGDAKH